MDEIALGTGRSGDMFEAGRHAGVGWETWCVWVAARRQNLASIQMGTMPAEMEKLLKSLLSLKALWEKLWEN